MNTKIKDYLGIALIIASLALAYAAVSYVINQPDYDGGSFSVSATGKAIAKPDIAQFTFSVITEGGENLGELQSENAETADSIINFLIEGGVEEEDIETQDYNVNPRRQYHSCREAIPCPPPEIVGYTIHNTVSVKVRDLDVAGGLLGGVVDRGADSVSSLSFTIDNPDNLEAQAQGDAIAKARDKAKAIAKSGGFRLGKLLSVNIIEYPTAIPFRAMESVDEFGIGGGTVVPVQPGSEEVEVTVSVTYEIK